MKLHFEGNLDYQMQAIDAVCDLCAWEREDDKRREKRDER
jgi:hypothetical protein